MIADIEQLEQMDASELHARRLNAKEVLTPQRSTNFIIPVADGTVNLFGREQRLKTSTLTWERPERDEEQEILQGKSDELHAPAPLQDDSTRDDAEAKNDFWSITGDFIYRHHVEPRVKLYMPKEESGIDVWRIQLHGRWGSRAVLRYVDSPLARSLSLEASQGRDPQAAKTRYALPEQNWRSTLAS